jgi:hypothetical protein
VLNGSSNWGSSTRTTGVDVTLPILFRLLLPVRDQMLRKW